MNRELNPKQIVVISLIAFTLITAYVYSVFHSLLSSVPNQQDSGDKRVTATAIIKSNRPQYIFAQLAQLSALCRKFAALCRNR